ncbi:MAG: hypothetical protein JST93_04095 [Acidobacteria bacterium]|nr:hypothetical protein [Acidobacteriota bacterium]
MMNNKMRRRQFFAAGAATAGAALPRVAKAGKFAERYRFVSEHSSGFSFLVDALTNPLTPNAAIADRVRSGALRQRERVEFPYGDGDTMRSLAYFEDPAKPFSADNEVPSGDPRILIEIFTDVTSVLVKNEPFPHLVVIGLIVENPTSTFFGNLTSRVMVFSAALDAAGSDNLSLVVSSTASSHVLGARTGSGRLQISEGGLR